MREDDPDVVHLQAGTIHVWARSIRGARRSENQDAWCILTSEGVGWGPWGSLGRAEKKGPSAAQWVRDGGVVAAVFDGLGGHPNGRQAARRAAQVLPGVAASDPPRIELMGELERAVRETGGATTAVVAFVAPGGPNDAGPRLRIVSVGDSAAYGLDGESLKGEGQGKEKGKEKGKRKELRRWNPLDRSSRHELTDCLGAADAVGHESHPPLGPGVVLVSDGIDGVVPLGQEWGSLLSLEPSRVAGELQRLFKQVEAAGAPDNATGVVVRCVPG